MMFQRWLKGFGLAALFVLLAGCGIATPPATPADVGLETAAPTIPPTAVRPDMPTPTVSPRPSPTASTTPTAAPTASVPGPTPMPTVDVAGPAQALAAAAQADLAARLGVDPTRISVVSAEAKDWPDSSLGCPQPGFMYAQVITPGYRIVLSDGTRPYAYHTDRERVVYCEQDK